MSELAEIKRVSEDVRKLVKDFQDENDKRLKTIEEQKHAPADVEQKVDKINSDLTTMLERVEELWKKHQQPSAADKDAGGRKKDGEASPHMKAWRKLLKVGYEKLIDEEKVHIDQNQPDLKNLPDEVKATLLSTGVATEGGNWAPNEFVEELFRDVQEMSPMRRVARVHTTSLGSAEFPTHSGAGAAVRTAESGTRAAATTPTAGLVVIDTSELMARYDTTRKMVFDSAFDIEGIIREDMAEQIAIKEGNDFIKGSGTAPNPQGFLANVGNTVAIGAGIGADEVIALYYALKTPYAMNGTFLARRSVIEAVRKLQDTAGQYIWTLSVPGGLVDASPQSLMGRPLLEAPDVDAVGASGSGNRPMAFGDFRRGYIIVDHVAFRVLVDPYSAAITGAIRYYGYIYNGGAVVKAEALAAMDQ